MNMKNPYVRKRPCYSLKDFIRRIPQVTDFMVDLHPERAIDECTEFKIYWNKFHEARRVYFKRYPFWYLVARILRRKEVLY